MNDRYCPDCGTLNVQVARFCQACGARLRGALGPSVCARCGVTALPGDYYCDACGAALPASAMLIVEDTGWRVAVPDRAESTLGREDVLSGATPDVDLAPYGADTLGVSRRHARLRRAEDGYTLEDLNSVNFTYVNDERLEPGRQAALADGDHIALGSLRLIFRQALRPSTHAQGSPLWGLPHSASPSPSPHSGSGTSQGRPPNASIGGRL